MKYFFLIVMALTSFKATCQEIAGASRNDNTFQVYKKANELLSSGDTKEALALFDRIAAHFIHQNELKELPAHYMATALSLAFSGHYSQSIRYHKKALRAHRKYKSAEPNEAINMNLGLVYQLAGKDRKSKKHLGKHFS